MAGSSQRQTFLGKQLLTPAIRMLGWSSRRAADDPLNAHVHPNAYEICLIARGSVEWWAGKEVFEVGPGDLYITRPGEEHGGVDAVIQPCELYWVQPVLTPPSSPQTLTEGFERLSLRVFPGSPGVRRCFDRLLDEHRHPNPLSSIAVEAALHELLVAILRDHDAHMGRQKRHTDAISAPIHKAMQWMEARLAQDYAVTDAADLAGLSIAQFHERFRRETGFAPAAWRTRRRIALAKQLLRQPERSVTDVAMRTGFATSQYFATVFKKMVGLTPGEYRRRIVAQRNGREG